MKLSTASRLVALLLSLAISSTSRVFAAAFIEQIPTFRPRSSRCLFPLRAATRDSNDNNSIRRDVQCMVHDASTREARILVPLSTLAAAAAFPLASLAAEASTTSPPSSSPASTSSTSTSSPKLPPKPKTTYDTSLQKYFPNSLPNSVASRRVLSTLSSRGYMNRSGQVILGSTFCSAASGKKTSADSNSLLGQLELGLGAAAGAIALGSGVGGVPSSSSIQSLFDQKGGKVIIVYGPYIDISAEGKLLGQNNDRFGIGRSGIGPCGASLGVLNELKRDVQSSSSSSAGGKDSAASEWSVKSLVSGQENTVLSQLRQDLLAANVDLNSSDQDYLMAEVTKKLFNLVSDATVQQVDGAIKRDGFWSNVSEVVLLGGIVVDREDDGDIVGSGSGATKNKGDGKEGYFKPVTFQSVQPSLDGRSVNSVNLMNNLFDGKNDNYKIPKAKKAKKSSGPSVSMPTVPAVSAPKLTSLPAVSAPSLLTLPDVSGSTKTARRAAPYVVGAGVGAAVVGGISLFQSQGGNGEGYTGKPSKQNKAAIAAKNNLRAVSEATDRGQGATLLQQNTARSLIRELESLSTVPAGAISSGMIEGMWELLYSDTYAFRSNPFFMAARSACADDVSKDQLFEATCNVLQGVVSEGTVGNVRQMITQGKLISEIELGTGGDVDSAIISTAAVRPSASGDPAAWDVSLQSTEVKGPKPAVIRQLGDIKASMTGVIRAPPFKTTYLDNDLRISRDQDNNVFVFGKVSRTQRPLGYSTIAAETTKLI